MRYLAISFLCLTVLLPAFAQKKNLTLEQVKQIALERNLSVVQAQNNLTATQSQVLAARGEYLPTLSANAGWSRVQTEQRSTGSQFTIVNGVPVPISSQAVNEKSWSNNFSTGASANWTVFDGFGREASNSSATDQSIAAEHSVARTRQGVVFQAVSDYLNVLRTRQLVGVSEENLKRDQRQLERITESNRVGALSLADVYRQQSQVASDELLVINAQNNHDKAKADLLSFIGLDVSEDYDFLDPTIPSTIDSASIQESIQLTRDFSGLARRAMQARPDYLGAMKSLEAAESGVTGAKSTYFPSLGIFGNYSGSAEDIGKQNRNTNLSWGARLNWTLFDGFRTNQSVQLATASRRNAEIQLAQAELNINVDVKKALLDLDAARKSYEATIKGLISATEDRKIAEERYNLGAGTLLDLLTANANLVNAQANNVNAIYGFLNSKLNLEYAIGERSF